MAEAPELEQRLFDFLASQRDDAVVRETLAPLFEGGRRARVPDVEELLEALRGSARRGRARRARRDLASLERELPQAMRGSLGDWRSRLSDVLRSAPWTSHPALLLPLRIETSFAGDFLRVRFYPDPISIHTHEPELTRAELDAADWYEQTALDSSATAEQQQAAWRRLATRFGSRRAGWIATCARTSVSAPVDPPPGRWTRAPQMAALPERFHVYGYRDGHIVLSGTSEPVRSGRSPIAAPDSTQVDGLFDEASRWAVDFDTAVSEGFAIEKEITELDRTDGFDRLIVVGLRWADSAASAVELSELFQAHRFSAGIGFVERGTPTNNTPGEAAGASSADDVEQSYAVEVTGPRNWQHQSTGPRRTNGHTLARALGFDAEDLRYVEGAGLIGASFADEMNAVTWPVTGDYYLRHLLPQSANAPLLKYIAEHHRRFVRGGGPLPAIRIGSQPYGILPVTRVQRATASTGGWSPSETDAGADPTRDDALHALAARLFDRWLDCARHVDAIPRVQALDPDPDRTLLGILAMQPLCAGYRAQPIVDERLVAWMLVALRNHIFGAGSPYAASGILPAQWIAAWNSSWQQIQGRVATALADLAQTSPTQFLGEPLLRTMAWQGGRTTPTPLTDSDDPAHPVPAIYLGELAARSATTADTVLAHVARLALQLTDPAEQIAVRRALYALSATDALDFFNEVTDAQQIVDRIEDDPAHHPRRDGYGVRSDVARRIMDKRTELGGRFESIEEVDEVFGIGEDTLHDILYTFRDFEGRPDIDTLFRESLDIASHRVDGWMTSFATKRLHGMRERPDSETGLHLGAYGVVENLRPRTAPPSAGYVHGPSAAHSAMGAVLHNGYLTHHRPVPDDQAPPDNPLAINLTSGRVRAAERLHGGVRAGQPMGAVLGYRIERALKDSQVRVAQYIDSLRALFPVVAHKLTEGEEAVETVAARNVVDGAALVRSYREIRRLEHEAIPGTAPLKSLLDAMTQPQRQTLRSVLEDAHDALDASSDALIAESVFQAVQGNFERAAAATRSSHGDLPPPELESLRTPVSGRSYTHRAGIVFTEAPASIDPASDPRAAMEPRLAAWFHALIGSPADIGIGFDFWEAETDADVLARVDLNTADAEALQTLTRINAERAGAIIAERRDGGRFKQLADLARVTGIGRQTIADLAPLATTGYRERVDLNSASRDALLGLPGVVPDVADAIIASRAEAPLARVEEITKIDGIGSAKYRALRRLTTARRPDINHATAAQLIALPDVGTQGATRILERRAQLPFDGLSDLAEVDFDVESVEALGTHASTSFGVVGLDELDLSPSDVVYALEAGPGGTSGLELQVARRVRELFDLPETQPIEILAHLRGTFAHSLADLAGLTQQAMSALAAAHPMTRQSFSHPAVDADEAAQPDAEVAELRARLDAVRAAAQLVKGGLETAANAEPYDVVTAHDALVRAAQYGIPGAEPAGYDDATALRVANVLGEFDKRLANSDPDVVEADTVKDLVTAVEVLFGRPFVVLPTFVPDHAAALGEALLLDRLAGLGPDRLRTWWSQAAQVDPALATFEDLSILRDSWREACCAPGDSLLELELAQLPLDNGRYWIGLDDAEKGPESSEEKWARSPLSVVFARFGPALALDASPPVPVAGVMLSEWSETVPSSRVNTSVAFQYDAPNAQAPQSLLLAVPGEVSAQATFWTPRELAAIVHDTVDLAKVRTVDSDALAHYEAATGDDAPIGAFMPGIYLPADASRPGWARDIAMGTLDDWVETLTQAPPRPDVELADSLNMYVDFHQQDGNHFVSDAGLRIIGVDGQALTPGLFDANPTDSGSVRMSDVGARIELPPDLPQVVLIAGWHGTLEPHVVVYDSLGQPMDAGHEAEEREHDNPAFGSPQSLSLGSTDFGTYRIFQHTLYGEGMHAIELTGRGLINLIFTYRLAED